MMEEWVCLKDDEPMMIATVTESGYSNGFITKWWLTECFDPYTQNRAGTSRRLLFLDGLDSHTQIDFLEACWDRNIVCLILPAHLSGVFQPLDVNFFNPLKLAYHKQIDDYQLGSEASRVTKAFFYRWFQRAWAATANSRIIRSAWAKSGLWPLSESVMRARQTTPETRITPVTPITPHNKATSQAMVRGVQRGENSPTTAILKMSKAFERVEAEKVLLEKDLEKRWAAEELDKAARGSNKRTRFPQGQLFDQKYQEDHAQELQARKDAEKEGRARKKRAAGAKWKVKAPNTVESLEAGPSNTVQEDQLLACILCK